MNPAEGCADDKGPENTAGSSGGLAAAAAAYPPSAPRRHRNRRPAPAGSPRWPWVRQVQAQVVVDASAVCRPSGWITSTRLLAVLAHRPSPPGSGGGLPRRPDLVPPPPPPPNGFEWSGVLSPSIPRHKPSWCSARLSWSAPRFAQLCRTTCRGCFGSHPRLIARVGNDT